MDMQAEHRALHGPDLLTNLKVSPSQLRQQLEFELRSKWIQLQQRFLHADGNEKILRELLGRSLSSVTALFRATLRLIGEKVPAQRREIWMALSKHVPVSLEALDDILLLREGTKHSSMRLEYLFTQLYETVQAVTQFVDRVNN
jgi:hypothetical protein